jgi:UDP-N-acetylmuramoyl-L-alanyl-D-glutamate--2,6-diaminopimelate ligase
MVQLPPIFPVTSHTDRVGPGSTFVALRGSVADGVDFIPVALEKGATKIVVAHSAQLSQALLDQVHASGAELYKVDNPRRALAYLSAEAADWPARKLCVLGITGTKGKSTTSFLVEHIVRSAGYKTALLTTVRNTIGDTVFETNLTTQHPDYLHQFLLLCVKNNVQVVVMEVAAQAGSLHRTDGIEFDGFVFTNFSQEHGEFYCTFEEYFDAKRALTNQLKPGRPLVLNGDDELVAYVGSHKANAIFYGLTAHDQLYVTARAEKGSLAGLTGFLRFDQTEYPFKAPALAGDFNLYNILAAASLTYMLGLDPAAICAALATFVGVPGRMEKYELPNGAVAFIDYAHNPSSFEAILTTLCALTDDLTVVFGCGGDRDTAKRPVMGALAAKYAQHVIITTDNPRSEEASDIAEQIIAGIGIADRARVTVELDRQKAIQIAYSRSKKGSVIALLGKGPDEYQLIKGVKTAFSEKAILKTL